MNKLEERDRCFKMFNLPRLNKEEIKIMNKPISTQIKIVIKYLSTIKSLELVDFTGKFDQKSRDALMPILL